jgi:hypothetical protein
VQVAMNDGLFAEKQLIFALTQFDVKRNRIGDWQVAWKKVL